MEYLLLSYAQEAGWAQMSEAEQEQGRAAYMAYAGALRKAGVLKASNRLQPIAAATTLPTANGKQQVLDGPYEPYWAARADLLTKTGNYGEARQAYELATGFERDKAVRRFLLERMSAPPN